MLLSLGAVSASADPVLVYPLSNLVRTTGVLEPSLELGRGGLSLLTQGGSARAGASHFAVRGAFPLERSEEPRISGWSWSFSLGATSFESEHAVMCSPST